VDLKSLSGMLRSVGWFVTDVSGQRIGPILKVKMAKSFPMDILTLKKRPIYRPKTSVTNQPTLHNNPYERRSDPALLKKASSQRYVFAQILSFSLFYASIYRGIR
jgi:hypothetical protein